jgi:chromosome segregation ATPase
LSNTTQKSQESQQALELLFQEKKKVKQLEQQLLLAHKEKALHNEALKNAKASSPTNPTEVSRLQKLITESEQEIALLQGQQKRLKDLYREQQQETATLRDKLKSNENSSEELNAVKLSLHDAQQHSRQLERVIQFLRERAEEAQLEAKQTVTEFQSSQEIIAALKEDVKSTKQEWSDLSIHYANEKQAKQELLKELHDQQNQLSNLKQQFLDAQSVPCQQRPSPARPPTTTRPPTRRKPHIRKKNQLLRRIRNRTLPRLQSPR